MAKFTVLKDILQIGELVILELELDELGGRGVLKVGARSELVGQPEFGGHGV